jgi:hypothetical protein
LICSLRGVPRADAEMVALEGRLQDNPAFAHAACRYWIRKLQAGVHAGDYAAALQMGARARRFCGRFDLLRIRRVPLLQRSRARGSLSSAGARGGAPRGSRAHQAQLATWAKSCAETFGSRAALAAAELARLEDRILEAESSTRRRSAPPTPRTLRTSKQSPPSWLRSSIAHAASKRSPEPTSGTPAPVIGAGAPKRPHAVWTATSPSWSRRRRPTR